ncbi:MULTISPECIES: TIGR00730 family Rossman fold protein [unclassified Wenzhouxiangella]|uniref:LOG family protein n=1 Tax=unclassified Wenzhouxiangella TaxID=2613841 RepID=UPI000E32C340|nr:MULTISPECIES: TIGR00730 family Rossman fold protein [unclassified Wenzhouxiangella]RFF27176.1 TIGR00730 family Rossman fold protein [Wenzhouxiangella sp. 15181]RFP69137.1 TIGR00730 family Rossman fold protein [Wenzhouxiangella sp. 15190]
MSIKSVTVYAASSQALEPIYIDAAERLGRTLGSAGLRIIYGGGSTGLMGAMADGALAEGAEVLGIIPEFLTRVERGHQGLRDLEVVSDMRIRKARMLDQADAVVALPGGCGTFEELFEAMTLKRLGQFLGPIVLINTEGYYDRLLDFLGHSVKERFMNHTHLDMWQTVEQPEDALRAMREAVAWSAHEALESAAVRRTP